MSAARIVYSVLFDDAPAPTAHDFKTCSATDLTCALTSAANAYVRRAESILARNNATLDGEAASRANKPILLPLALWKQVAADHVNQMASSADRATMVDVIVMCLDHIKDLEWELVDGEEDASWAEVEGERNFARPIGLMA